MNGRRGNGLDLDDRRVRAAATMAVLGLLLVIGLTWGFSAATEPFPKKAPATDCVDSTVAEGDELRPAAVTVSVLNAGDSQGLAGRTLDDLENAGFDPADQGNAPSDADVDGVQIWTDDPDSPAVALLRSYLGKGAVEVVERDTPEPGVNVVVGDGFPGVTKGRKKITAQTDGVVCSPPGLA